MQLQDEDLAKHGTIKMRVPGLKEAETIAVTPWQLCLCLTVGGIMRGECKLRLGKRAS